MRDVRVIGRLVDGVVEERTVNPFATGESTIADEMCEFIGRMFDYVTAYWRWDMRAPKKR